MINHSFLRYCILAIERCDGATDCEDGSDEANCDEDGATVDCEAEGQFKCHNSSSVTLGEAFEI